VLHTRQSLYKSRFLISLPALPFFLNVHVATIRSCVLCPVTSWSCACAPANVFRVRNHWTDFNGVWYWASCTITPLANLILFASNQHRLNFTRSSDPTLSVL
jgi:hypothetical protein